MKRVTLILAAVLVLVVVALVLLPQRKRTVTVRPGNVRITPYFGDGARADNVITGASEAMIVQDGRVGPFTKGNYAFSMLVLESRDSSAQYDVELIVDGEPTTELQEVRIDVWRRTLGGAWKMARNRWKASRFNGTTRPVMVHVRTPDGGVVVGEHVVCNANLVRLVKTDARGDADCGLLTGEVKVLVVGDAPRPRVVADGTVDVHYTLNRP